ncbi:MAG TPA: hypothetical protein VGC37_14910 [Friedmanniella sp.]
MIVLVANVLASLMRWNRRHLPSHRLVAAVRTRRGLRWGLPLVCLGIAYLYLGAVASVMVEHGTSHGLYLLTLACWVGGGRLIANGLVATERLIVARCRERLAVLVATRQENRTRQAEGYAPVSRDEARAALADYRSQIAVLRS